MQDKINELITKIKAIDPTTDTDRRTWNRLVLCSNGQDAECRSFSSEQDTVSELKTFLELFEDDDLIGIEQDNDGIFYISAYRKVSYTDEEYLAYLEATLHFVERSSLEYKEFRLPTGKVIYLSEAEINAMKEQLK
jgi:hypothetical protein